MQGAPLDEADNQPLISCTATWESGTEKQSNVSAALFDDTLTLSAPGFHRELRLSALISVCARNYRVFVRTDSGESVLSMIGHLYEDFAKKFIRAYNEVLFNESLMRETVHFETTGAYTDPSGETSNAALRICETALVVLPDTHNLVRIPYCMIADTDIQPYRFSVTDRLGRVYMLSKMGFSTDAFLHAYQERISELIRQTREMLAEIAPADDRLAAFMMEGLIQPLSDIGALSEGFAAALDKRIAASEIANEYQYLRSISNNIALGVKRGLMGELTGESILILTPVFDRNVFIMESLGDTSAATYVFRLTESGPFNSAQWHRFLLEFNDSMLSVNFRREPILLSEEALGEAQYETYKNALRRVPALIKLRSLFVGRAVHSGVDAWKKKLESYMQ
jgi:hypothetical protein